MKTLKNGRQLEMKQNVNNKKFKSIDIGNGINVGIVDGRDGKIVEINVSGQKKKLEDVDLLINALIICKQWLSDNKLNDQ